jgi:hypothetical protein
MNRQRNNGSDPQPSVKAFCAVHRSISAETVRALMKRGLLHLKDDRWRLGDASNPGITRSLNDLDWKYSHSNANTWHGLIGLCDVIENDRREAWLVIEGSKDALAAAEIANRKGVLHQVGILAALGSGYRPIPSELNKLRGRKLFVIGDNDTAGFETTQIVSCALTTAKIEHSLWNWNGGPCKDLYEWLARRDAHPASLGSSKSFVVEQETRARACVNGKSSPPPSPLLTVLPFCCSTTQCPSTTQRAAIGENELLQFIEPFIVTKKGTGNRMSFELARAVKAQNLDPANVDRIFQLWFEKSRPMLPPQADQTESQNDFYRRLKRVRFPEKGLSGAIERARTARLPDIASLNHNEAALRLAALCRELQRETGQRPFICSVNVAQKFLQLRWPSQANYLLHILEGEKVIECVDRGRPNKPGVKGKTTLWRYKLPMD